MKNQESAVSLCQGAKARRTALRYASPELFVLFVESENDIVTNSCPSETEEECLQGDGAN